MDDSYDSVFAVEPRLVIDEARAQQELQELGEELEVLLDGLHHNAHDLPPYPATDAGTYSLKDEGVSDSSDDEAMEEEEEEEEEEGSGQIEAKSSNT